MYVNVGYPWRGHDENHPPFPATEHNYVGQYRRSVLIPTEWAGMQICLKIGSATSNVRVWVNGKKAGYSEDSKLEARFDISRLVRPGKENLIALEVFRWCDGTYLEDQDFWRLSGIARGVELIARGKDRVEDVNILADMEGHLDVTARVTPGVGLVGFQLLGSDLALVDEWEVEPTRGVARLETRVDGVRLWSAEEPNLYTLHVSAICRREEAESADIDFGFRSVKVEGNQLLVNGKPVLIKGVNRHELSPTGGYHVTYEEMEADIRTMKELNINAVRTCHYPNDPLWLTLCDIYGLYVVDEANVESHGMSKRPDTVSEDPAWLGAHLERIQRMVYRDFNHPCVIVWSLGNECGPGASFQAGYDWIHSYDPSRPVQYEPAARKGKPYTDIFCPMYHDLNQNRDYLLAAEKPLIQCEYAHAMGNSMGNFKEYWDLIRSEPAYQGGFIWDFADQALRYPAELPGTDHLYLFGGDFNAYDPSDGSFNCNGVVAADRSWHPHAYEVRYQYQDIHTRLLDASGRVEIYNERFFTDLSDVRLVWTLSGDGDPIREGVVENLAVAPQGKAVLTIPVGELPFNQTATLLVAYRLKEAKGLLPAGSEIAYDQFVLRRAYMPEDLDWLAYVSDDKKVAVERGNGSWTLSGEDLSAGILRWSARFDEASGLASYCVNGQEMMAEPMLPCVNRAMTENDLGTQFDRKLAPWRSAAFTPESVVVADHDGYVSVEYSYAPIGDAARIRVSYHVLADGRMVVEEKMEDAGGLSEAPALPRFGLRFAMNGAFSDLDFFGLGPWENYADRCSAALLGHYRQLVEDQYHYGYVRSQESGTHTGISRLSLSAPDGIGLTVSSSSPFSASALPFSLEQLDTHVHSLELKAAAFEGRRSLGKTFVHLDAVQMGVGGINSWGKEPLPAYMIPAAERSFTFVLSPLASGI